MAHCVEAATFGLSPSLFWAWWGADGPLASTTNGDLRLTMPVGAVLQKPCLSSKMQRGCC